MWSELNVMVWTERDVVVWTGCDCMACRIECDVD